MVSKTREKLLDVARQLFAHKGVENTTISDIATASDKGRRTIYTYFRNKREIYNAVIERESEILVAKVKDIANSTLAPVEKLRQYLNARFDIIENAVHNGSTTNSLKAILSLDFNRVEKIRRLASSKEAELFARVINEGVNTGVFDAEQAQCVLAADSVMFQGVDYSFLRNNFEELNLTKEKMRNDIINFFVNAMVKNKQYFN
ncbi:MAG: TetR/AcrR family transcriptional regulator [Duncaniella sp.]|nr:TetR/AcrR family transcriptional regulator [Duncaniella sp.]